MSRLSQCTILFLVYMVYSATAATVDPVTIPGNGETGTCPAQEDREAAIQNIRASATMITQNSLTTPNMQPINCGSGQWYRVAYLNMNDSSQQCPSPWREYTDSSTSGVRGCGRPRIHSTECSGTFYAISRQYSRVCGRIIGWEVGVMNGFRNGIDIDSPLGYINGLSVTYGGPPRNHIWSFVGVNTENDPCPCSSLFDPSTSYGISRSAPSFVGNNYFCESGNPTNQWAGYLWYSADPLWDGQGCGRGECCNNPPWFSVELPNPTTDDIEMRICSGGTGTGDGSETTIVAGTTIQLIELYVQ